MVCTNPEDWALNAGLWVAWPSFVTSASPWLWSPSHWSIQSCDPSLDRALNHLHHLNLHQSDSWQHPITTTKNASENSPRRRKKKKSSKSVSPEKPMAPRVQCTWVVAQTQSKLLGSTLHWALSKPEPAPRAFQCSRFNAGNKITSRMLALLVSNIIKRSMPMPHPPVGGMPYSSARTKSWSKNMASSSPLSFCSTWA